jgi:arginase
MPHDSASVFGRIFFPKTVYTTLICDAQRCECPEFPFVAKLRSIGVIGITHNVGWKGEGLDKGPAALRKAGIVGQLSQVAEMVADLGDVEANLPPPDDTNPRLLNPYQVVAVCRAVAPRVRSACEQGYFPLILGAEDSVIMGIIEGLKQGFGETIGLIYMDAHGDFNTPDTTPSGLIGGMDVALLAGHGPDLLTSIFGHKPQLREEQITLFGVRDLDPPEREMLVKSKVHLYTMDKVRELGPERAMKEATEKLLRASKRLYIHIDIDVLDPKEIGATQLPVPDGLGLTECSTALRVVRQSGRLCGLDVMVFNAHKDPNGEEARKLNQLVVDSLQ